MGLKIIWGDITKERTNALTTLASRLPKVGSGVDKAVHAAAGDELLKARLRAIKEMGPGIAVSTPSYGLKRLCGAKNVIHASSIPWEGGGHDERLLLDAAYVKVVAIASALAAKTLTVPVMGAGKYGMPKELALEQAVMSLRECARLFPGISIKLVTNEEPVFRMAELRYAELCESHYSTESEKKALIRFPRPERIQKGELTKPWICTGKEKDYWVRLCARQFSRLGDSNTLLALVWDDLRKRSRIAAKDGHRADAGPVICSTAGLAEASGVSLSNVKHVLSGESRRPTRDVLLALCIALGLRLPFIKVILNKCGHSFKTGEEARIIGACVNAGYTTLDEVNEALEAHLGKGQRLCVELRTKGTGRGRDRAGI